MKKIIINLSEGFQISFNAKVLLFFGCAAAVFIQISGRIIAYIFEENNHTISLFTSLLAILVRNYNFFSLIFLFVFIAVSLIQAHNAKARETILVKTNF